MWPALSAAMFASASLGSFANFVFSHEMVWSRSRPNS
jgi:hypothetical protein